MKKGSFGFVLLVVIIGITLSGCGCFQEAKKGETPPPARPAPVVQPAPAPACPACPACPPAVVCPPEKVCQPCPQPPPPPPPPKKDRN
jgi:peptidoglycan-associated lipoprotein